MKLTSKIHGIIDILVVLFLIISPSIFHLPPMTSAFTYVLAGVHLTLTLFTNFEVGIFKIIPLKIHGLIELIVSVALIGVAFYLHSIEGGLARNFYLAFGSAVFITWLITDYETSSTK